MMSKKIIEIPGIGPVTFTKVARSRTIRLRVTNRGVFASLPSWSPYETAVAFVKKHTQWINDTLQEHTRPTLREGDKIGKLHTLHFVVMPQTNQLRTSVTPTKLIIPYHPDENVSSTTVQSRAEAASIRALKKEAAVVLPQRLDDIAKRSELSYSDIKIKNLTRRWGSCDSRKHIVLNLFLMQLSWQQIDYVICHELAHTNHMNHGSTFWKEVERMMPDARMIAKRVRHIQPALMPTKTATAFDDDMPY